MQPTRAVIAPVIREALSGREARGRLASRSLVASMTSRGNARVWNATRQHEIANRAFRGVAKAFDPKQREPLTRYFEHFPLKDKKKMMNALRDMGRVAEVLDHLKGGRRAAETRAVSESAKEKTRAIAHAKVKASDAPAPTKLKANFLPDLEKKELIEKTEKELTGKIEQFASHLILGMALNQALMLEEIAKGRSNLKSELELLGTEKEGEPIPHFFPASKKDKEQFMAELKKIHALNGELAETNHPIQASLIRQDLQAHLAAFIKHIGFKPDQVPGFLQRLQEQFVDFDMLKIPDWRQSIEFELLTRGLSAFACVIVVALLSVGLESLEEFFDRENIKETKVLRQILTEELADHESEISDSKFHISELQSQIELFATARDPEIQRKYEQTKGKLQKLYKDLRKLNGLIGDIRQSIPVTNNKIENVKPTKKGEDTVTVKLSRLKNQINHIQNEIRGTSEWIKEAALTERWHQLSADIVVLTNVLRAAHTRPKERVQVNRLLTTVNTVIHSTPNVENSRKLEAVYQKVKDVLYLKAVKDPESLHLAKNAKVLKLFLREKFTL